MRATKIIPPSRDRQFRTLPVLGLYERYRDSEIFLTGAFGGGKIVHSADQGHTPR